MQSPASDAPLGLGGARGCARSDGEVISPRTGALSHMPVPGPLTQCWRSSLRADAGAGAGGPDDQVSDTDRFARAWARWSTTRTGKKR
jgi:hypothetical protein